MKFCILALLKIGKKEHIESLLHKGEVYFNTTTWYKEQEEKNEEQGDVYETACWVYKFDDLLIQNENGKWEKLNSAPFVVRQYDSTINQGNAFCMYAFHKYPGRKISYPLINREKFGNTTLCIYRPKIFIDRVEKAIKDVGLSCFSGPVKYYDQNTINGPISPFHKRAIFEPQQEARIFIPNTNNKPIPLCIGDISDIAFIVTDDILEISFDDNGGIKLIRKINEG